MITHVVYWTMKPEAEGRSGRENAQIMKEKIENLRGKVPSLLEVTIGINFLPTTTEEVELILISKHHDANGLKDYAEHPLHLEVVEFVKKIITSRKSIDFATED